MKSLTAIYLLVGTLFAPLSLVAASPEFRNAVIASVAAEYPSLATIYHDLHEHPELSFMETRTAGIVAVELRAVGCEVTEGVGNTGVVGVLRNGPGPTVMIRADMDALPIKEATGLDYASTAMVKDFAGNDQPSMHACAHDAHTTGLIGTARILAAHRAHWSGTVLFVAQPAEEIGAGARAMLTDGLFTKFPTPDFVLGLHVGGDMAAGQLATLEGPSYANVDSIDVLVRGIGGHGARPHSTRDPIVLASQIVTALQTIVSRELRPGTPAVVTVGSIQGGTKHNIIPAEVKLQLTLRSYEESVANHLIASIKRICENTARAVGLPEDLLPVVTVYGSRTPLTYNDPALTRRVDRTLRNWFPAERFEAVDAATYGEDFSEYGRTQHKVPITIFWVGGTDPVKLAEGRAKGQLVPSNHSAFWAPVPGPTIMTSVLAMSAAALDLLGKK
ncbi:MAG: amidohydrolase [Candidatus Didemnitutus sp.]|nr:amidohydrolase [Candidatus Didemnitutus sp.]